MKRKLFLFVIILVVLLAGQVYAQSKKVWVSPPKNSTVDKNNRQTLFNNVTDFFATLGKSPSQAKKIKKKRRYRRRQTRQEVRWRKEDAKKKRLLEKQQKKVMEKVRAINDK